LLTWRLYATRGIAEVSEALGEDAVRVRAAVELLSDNGLIEDGAGADDDRAANAETLDFFRRVGGARDDGLLSSEAYRRLVTSSVVICAADSDVTRADALRRLLSGTGMCRVSVVRTPADITCGGGSSERPAPSWLVACSTSGEDVERNDEVDACCASRGVAWLRAVLDEKEGYADIGPLFRPNPDPW